MKFPDDENQTRHFIEIWLFLGVTSAVQQEQPGVTVYNNQCQVFHPSDEDNLDQIDVPVSSYGTFQKVTRVWKLC